MDFMNFSHLPTLPASCYQEAEIHQCREAGQSKSGTCCRKVALSQFIAVEYSVQFEFTISVFIRPLCALPPHRPGREHRKCHTASFIPSFITSASLLVHKSRLPLQQRLKSRRGWEITAFASTSRELNKPFREGGASPIASLLWKVERYRWTGAISAVPQSGGDALSRRSRRFITPLPRWAAPNLTSCAPVLCWANEKNSLWDIAGSPSGNRRRASELDYLSEINN